MEIGKKIKNIREAKGMSAKQVTAIADIGSAMYSRIENGVNDPSLTTLEKIAKALDVKLSDFFSDENPLSDVSSYDATTTEKIKMVEELSEEDKKMVFAFLDALVSKQKLKDALKNAINIAS